MRNKVQQRQHLLAFANDAGEIEALLKGTLQLHVFFPQTARFHCLRHLCKEFVVGPRLGDVIHGAAFEGRARHIDRAISGNQDDGKMGIPATDLLQQVQTVAVGKTHVEQQQIKRVLFKLGQTGFAGSRTGNTVTLAGEQQLQALAYFGFVVDHQDRAFRHGLLLS